jgi:hypothetical protein
MDELAVQRHGVLGPLASGGPQLSARDSEAHGQEDQREHEAAPDCVQIGALMSAIARMLYEK